MYDIIIFAIFVVVSFLMFMSLIYLYVDRFGDEEKLFSSAKRALMLYTIAGMISAILTYMSCCLLKILQIFI